MGVVAAMGEVMIGMVQITGMILDFTPLRVLGQMMKFVRIGSKLLGRGVKNCDDLKYPGHQFTEVDEGNLEEDVQGLDLCGLDHMWDWTEYV